MDAQVNVQLPIPSVSIDTMIAMRDAALARYTQAAELIAEAHDIATRGNVGTSRMLYSNRAYKGIEYQIATDLGEVLRLIRRDLDRGAWSYLMDQSGLRTFMDAKTREKWSEALNGHAQEFPEFTPENVAATFGTLYAQRGTMFEDGVVECFRSLSWDYKTNNPCRFGRRIIMRGIVWYGHIPEHRTCDKLDDLVRVFHVTDGKPEPDHRTGVYQLIHHAPKDARQIETEYFRVRWFKNGNGHVTFTRPDLVEKLNQIIAKRYPGALPPRVD